MDNIEHIESTTYNGYRDRENLSAAERQSRYRQCAGDRRLANRATPASARNPPPLIINFSASSVPILQLGVSGKGLSEQQPERSGPNFLRAQLVTVPGAVVPFPYGGKQRQIMINMNAGLLQSKGLSPQDRAQRGEPQNPHPALRHREDRPGRV